MESDGSLLKSRKPCFREFESGGLRWTAAPEAESFIASWPPRDAPLRVLRSLDDREVREYAGPPGCPGFVVKSFDPPSPAGLAACLLLGSRARREFSALCKASALGVPAAESLAFGEGGDGSSVLILRALPGRDLATAFEAAGSGPAPGDVRLFAGFMRSVHDAGVLHADLHPGNIVLVSDRPPSFRLVDAAGLRFGRNLDLGERLRNLAVLNLYFFIRAPRHARFRFLKEYLRDFREPSCPDPADLAARVEAMTAQLAGGLWRSKASKCLGGNRRFAAAVAGGIRVVMKRCPEAEAAMKDIGGFFRRGGEILKDSRGALSAIRVLPESGTRVFAKIFRPRGRAERLLGLFRMPAAFRAMRKAWALELRGLPAARPILAAASGPGGSGESVFLAEEIRGTALDRRLAASDPAARRGIIESFGRAVAEMHRRGVRNRDLKASNVMVRDSGTGIFFCDLDGISVMRSVPPGKRAKDLARAVLSLAGDCGASVSETDSFVEAYRRRAGIRAATALAARGGGGT